MKHLTAKSIAIAALGFTLALTSGCQTSGTNGHFTTFDQSINRQLPVNLGGAAGPNVCCINSNSLPKKVFRVLKSDGTAAPAFLFAGPRYMGGSANVIPNPNHLPRLVLSWADSNIWTGFVVYSDTGLTSSVLGCGFNPGPWSMTITLPTGTDNYTGTVRCVVYYNDSAAPIPMGGSLLVGSQYIQ